MEPTPPPKGKKTKETLFLSMKLNFSPNFKFEVDFA